MDGPTYVGLHVCAEKDKSNELGYDQSFLTARGPVSHNSDLGHLSKMT